MNLLSIHVGALQLPMAWEWTEIGAIIAVGAVAALVLIYGALRYWLIVTRPANVQDVHTPTIDRLNAQALDQLAAAHEGEAPAEVAQDEAAPADLLAAVPPETTSQKPASGPQTDGSSRA